MKNPSALILASALALGCYDAAADDKTSEGKEPASAQTSVPEPIAVTVFAVDPEARTMTVREIRAVPAGSGKPAAVDAKLSVASNASGKKLGDVQVGEKVAVTCEVKATVPKQPAMTDEVHPSVIKDCAKVIKIEAHQ
jgi:hypothetical protein